MFFVIQGGLFAQISPGELTVAHQKLEGLSNCTQCHVLGEKVTNEKCMSCHKEIQSLIRKGAGYHASEEVENKDCFTCHSEHHGRNFQLIRLDENSFNHDLTGYKLEGKHRTTACAECHQTKNIQEDDLKHRKNSFLGLTQNCLSCHEDYHQETLSSDCASCHGFNSFKPAEKFDHNKADFILKGKHQQVECSKCHRNIERDGKPFQQFAGVAFDRCTACHTDVHQNKFGQNCTSCHSEASFHEVSGMGDFDHRRTSFPLEGKHQQVSCRSCHQQSLTAPLTHNKCIDCHSDYHKGQFASETVRKDCSECHDVKGFSVSSFTIEAHNQTTFKLEGAHLATPCFACHQKEKRWEFRQIGKQCVDCHENIHRGKIAEKYMPQQNCELCHNVTLWQEVTFAHEKTDFLLSGKHRDVSCRLCHFKQENGVSQQHFTDLKTDCESCHKDVHRGQFRVQDKTNCADCHDPEGWIPSRFDHNLSLFKLEGQHAQTACVKCHRLEKDEAGTFTKFKLKPEIKCADCHY